MQEAGLYKYWTSNAEDEGEREEFDQHNVKSLSISDLKSIFFLWSFGMGAAVSSLAYEITVYLMLGERRLINSIKLQ